MARPPATVYYDGACGMCVGTARAGQQHGVPGALRFVDNGSDEGRAALRALGMEARADDTLIVTVDDRVYTESGSVVEVARRLRWPRRAWTALWLVPRPLRDAVYRRVARNRSRACELPA